MCFLVFELVDFRFAWHECVLVVYFLKFSIVGCVCVWLLFVADFISVFVLACSHAVACLIMLHLVRFTRALGDCVRMPFFSIVVLCCVALCCVVLRACVCVCVSRA